MPYPDLPRPEAPSSIAVVRDFVNTTDHETGSDDLATATGLVRYLSREGLLTGTPRASTRDLDLAHRLRAGLRTALEQNHDGDVAPVPGLTEALGELEVTLAWGSTGALVVPGGGGVRGALARVGIAAHQAAADGLWWRLKICSSDECAWAYYDHSKNRSRQWCEYGCGNRIKTRAYRARRRAAMA